MFLENTYRLSIYLIKFHIQSFKKTFRKILMDIANKLTHNKKKKQPSIYECIVHIKVFFSYYVLTNSCMACIPTVIRV